LVPDRRIKVDPSTLLLLMSLTLPSLAGSMMRGYVAKAPFIVPWGETVRAAAKSNSVKKNVT